MEIGSVHPLKPAAAIEPARPAAPPAGEGAGPGAPAAFAATARSGPPPAGTEPAPAPGWKKLETLLVQQMLEGVLASEEGGFFGEGTGSDYYASFMAEQFAARLSDGLDLGIASRLDRHYRPE